MAVLWYKSSLVLLPSFDAFGGLVRSLSVHVGRLSCVCILLLTSLSSLTSCSSESKVHGDIRLLMVDSHPKGHVWMAQRARVRFEHIQNSSYFARWHLSTTRTNIASRGPTCAYFPRLSPVLDPGWAPFALPKRAFASAAGRTLFPRED